MGSPAKLHLLLPLFVGITIIVQATAAFGGSSSPSSRLLQLLRQQLQQQQQSPAVLRPVQPSSSSATAAVAASEARETGFVEESPADPVDIDQEERLAAILSTLMQRPLNGKRAGKPRDKHTDTHTGKSAWLPAYVAGGQECFWQMDPTKGKHLILVPRIT